MTKLGEIDHVMPEQNIAVRLTSNVYVAITRPCLTYRNECWAMKVNNKRDIATKEMRMHRGILRVSRWDHRRNEKKSTLF